MKWLTLLQRGYIAVGDQRFDLEHLVGQEFDLIVPASGSYPEIKISIQVEFTSHCVSFGPINGQKLDFDVLGLERKIYDHRHVPRAFCQDRYRWSLQLPAIIYSLDQQQCYFSGQGNWMLVKGIDDQGKLVDYEIFFRLRQLAPAMLRMVIESAYVRKAPDRGAGVPRSRKGAIRFYVMALKILRGDQLRDPRHSHK